MPRASVGGGSSPKKPKPQSKKSPVKKTGMTPREALYYAKPKAKRREASSKIRQRTDRAYLSPRKLAMRTYRQEKRDYYQRARTANVEALKLALKQSGGGKSTQLDDVTNPKMRRLVGDGIETPQLREALDRKPSEATKGRPNRVIKSYMRQSRMNTDVKAAVNKLKKNAGGTEPPRKEVREETMKLQRQRRKRVIKKQVRTEDIFRAKAIGVGVQTLRTAESQQRKAKQDRIAAKRQKVEDKQKRKAWMQGIKGDKANRAEYERYVAKVKKANQRVLAFNAKNPSVYNASPAKILSFSEWWSKGRRREEGGDKKQSGGAGAATAGASGLANPIITEAAKKSLRRETPKAVAKIAAAKLPRSEELAKISRSKAARVLTSSGVVLGSEQVQKALGVDDGVTVGEVAVGAAGGPVAKGAGTVARLGGRLLKPTAKRVGKALTFSASRRSARRAIENKALPPARTPSAPRAARPAAASGERRTFTVDSSGVAKQRIGKTELGVEVTKAVGRQAKGQAYTRPRGAVAKVVANPMLAAAAAGGTGVVTTGTTAIVGHFSSAKGRTTKTSAQALASSPAAMWSLAVDAGTSIQRAGKTAGVSMYELFTGQEDVGGKVPEIKVGPIDLGSWHVVRYTGDAITAPLRGQAKQQIEYYGPLVDLVTAGSYTTRSGQELRDVDAWEAALEEKYGYTLVPTVALMGKGGFRTLRNAMGWSARVGKFKMRMKMADVLDGIAGRGNTVAAVAPRPGSGEVAQKSARSKDLAAAQAKEPLNRVTKATVGRWPTKLIAKGHYREWANRMRTAAMKEELGAFLAEGVFSKNKTVAMRQVEQRYEDLVAQGRYAGEFTRDRFDNGLAQAVAKMSGKSSTVIPADFDLLSLIRSDPDLLKDPQVIAARDAFVEASDFVQGGVTFESPTRTRAPRMQFYGMPSADDYIPIARLREIDPNSRATNQGGLEDEWQGKEIKIGPKVTPTERLGNYRVVVAGPRELASAAARQNYAKRLRSVFESLPPGTTIVTGGFDGIDSIAQTIARQMGIEVEGLPSKWADRSTHAVIAVKTQKEASPGTNEMIKRAREAKIPVTFITNDGVSGAKRIKVTGDRELLEEAVRQYKKYKNADEFANPAFAKQQRDRAKADIQRLQPLVTEKRRLAQGRLDADSYEEAQFAALSAYRVEFNKPNATLKEMMATDEGKKAMRETIGRGKARRQREILNQETLPAYLATDAELARDKALIDNPAYIMHESPMDVQQKSTQTENVGSLPSSPVKKTELSLFKRGEINRSFANVVNKSIVRPLFIESQYEFARQFLAANALRPEDEFPNLGIRAMRRESDEVPIYVGEDLNRAMNASEDFRGYMKRTMAIPLSTVNKALNDPASTDLTFEEFVRDANEDLNAVRAGQVKFAKGNRYVLVRAIEGREFLGQLQAASKYEAGMRKFTRAQSKLVLGMSPAWAALQIPAEGAQAAIAGGYRYVTPHRDGLMDWRKLSQEDKDLWDAYAGGGPGPGTIPAQLANRENPVLLKGKRGASFNVETFDPDRFAFALAMLERTPVGKAVSSFAKVEWLGQLDKWKGGKFRSRLMRAQADRELNGMLGNAPEVFGLTKQLTEALRDAGRGPDGSKKKQMEMLLRDPKYRVALEELAAYVDDMLGNWTSFTRRERLPASLIFFYPFIRMSLKWLFYSLPKHHPARAALLYQLGGASASALKDMLTSSDGQTQDPQFLNLLMQSPLHGLNLTDDGYAKEGDIKLMNVARISPTTSAPWEFITNPDRPIVLVNMLPPLLSNAIGAAFGVDPLTGRMIVPEGASVSSTGELIQPSSQGKGDNASTVIKSGISKEQKLGFYATRLAGLPFPLRALLSGKKINPGDFPWQAGERQMKGLIDKLMVSDEMQVGSTWGIPAIESAGLVRDRNEFFQIIREMSSYKDRIDDISQKMYGTGDDKRRLDYEAQIASIETKINFRQKKIDEMSRKYGVRVVRDKRVPSWRRDKADLGSRLEKSPWFIGESSTGKNRPLTDKPWRKTTP